MQQTNKYAEKMQKYLIMPTMLSIFLTTVPIRSYTHDHIPLSRSATGTASPDSGTPMPATSTETSDSTAAGTLRHPHTSGGPDAEEPRDTAEYMTLDACMAYAVEHSPSVQQQEYTNRNYRQEYIESITALVPSVSGTISGTTSFGRSVDPETNTYTTVANLDNSYSLSGQMPLFAGLSGINTVRAARVMRLMGIEELQQIRDEVALKTMQAYFDVVYYTENVRLAREQLETSTENLHKTQKLFELGLKSAADVAEIESQRASDDFLLTQQQNNLDLAKITLQQAMNYPSGREPQIDTRIDISMPSGAAAYGEVLAYALEKNPKAQQADYNVRQSQLKYKIAKGKYYPSLLVGGGYSTNFFMSLDDHSLYARFEDQFRDNRGYYFTARLSIPIFGGLSKRIAVNRARNNWRIAELQREETRHTLESEVAQAYQQMLGSGKEFVQASKKAEAAQLAYDAVAGKYERGIVSALDLQTAANNLLQARAERIRTRLQYIAKARLVAYYNGEPLIR